MSGITKGEILYSDAVTRAESFFEEIITILITSISFIVSVQLIKTKNSPVLNYAREEYLKAEFPIAAIGEEKVYSFKMFEILEKIADQQKIDSIAYVAYKKTLENISNVANATVFENQDTYYFIRKVIAGCYLTYYEKIKDTITQLYGPDPLHWPSELQFARVVRNAFAHHSLITIKNANVPPVNWRHLTYGSQDNGRNIFTDLYVVELIDLMKDIEPKLQ
jgi:abortive infection bacteriophage resistance protein